MQWENITSSKNVKQVNNNIHHSSSDGVTTCVVIYEGRPVRTGRPCKVHTGDLQEISGVCTIVHSDP